MEKGEYKNMEILKYGNKEIRNKEIRINGNMEIWKQVNRKIGKI